MKIARDTCIDPIPVCESVCGKRLACKIHSCENRCHEGECSPCNKVQNVSCECGLTHKDVTCSELLEMEDRSFKCNSICRTLSMGYCLCLLFEQLNTFLGSCGKHQCSNRCCSSRGENESSRHVCSLVCGKNLRLQNI